MNNRGFTILETLVAALVLAIALAGVAGLLQSSLQIARDYKDSVTAAMLAQEAMEMVRERRDLSTRAIPCDPEIEPSCDTTGWLDGLIVHPPLYPSAICEKPNGCIAKLQSSGAVTFERCPAPPTSCKNLLFDAGKDVFNYIVGGSATQFKRSVYVTLIGPNEAEVQVLVNWPGMTTQKSLLLETHLFQWQL